MVATRKAVVILVVFTSISLFSFGTALGSLIGVDWVTGGLYSISDTDASQTFIGNTGLTQMGSLEFGLDGNLYGFTSGSSSQLYNIDPVTAAATHIGALSNGVVYEGGIAFAPDGTVYGTNQNSAASPTLFTLDLVTGLATNLGVISGGAHDINGLAWRDDGLLVGLDRVTNSLLTIDPFTLNTAVIAPVGPVVGDIGGITVAGDWGYFSVDGTNALYSFDLYTGAHSFIGNYNLTSDISGIAYVPTSVPEPSTLLLLGGGLLGLAGFRRKFKV